MPRPLSFTPSFLTDNILFLAVGSFISTLSVLFFDGRLYTTASVLALFLSVFLLFAVQAFAGSMKHYVTRLQILLFYARSYVITATLFCILYLFLLSFPFDWVLTVKLCLLVTFIETSLQLFVRYKKQIELNAEKEKRIRQTITEQRVRELEVLKQQIDPHFIFNSFNTLAYLIEEDSSKAGSFSNKLANVYRYLIFNSSKNLVSLADEAGFAMDYAYLQEIRHSSEISVSFTGFEAIDHVFVVPVSIQILLENAIKHNAFSKDSPLHIGVRFCNGEVLVENQITPQNGQITSSKIGLGNLRDRCSLILGKELVVQNKEGKFMVRLPVLQQ